MGGAGNVWNNAAVYPLWVTMAIGAGVFGFRCAHWVLFDQVRVANRPVAATLHAVLIQCREGRLYCAACLC